MNRDIFEGKWKQVRGEIRDWWGDLTDDDVERINGNYDRLIGRLQERYGWTREQAEMEIDQRMTAYENRFESKDPLSRNT